MHHNSLLPMVLVCDSSGYGVGTILSHRLPDGTDRPIAFASGTLSERQLNYAQIEQEVYALFWEVKNFRLY
jgi:hypothetical protein